MLVLRRPWLAFVGIPLDVPYVTLSTARVAASVGVLGFDTMLTAPFWWAVAGIASDGRTYNLAAALRYSRWPCARTAKEAATAAVAGVWCCADC